MPAHVTDENFATRVYGPLLAKLGFSDYKNELEFIMPNPSSAKVCSPHSN